jgi:hypothetical protein
MTLITSLANVGTQILASLTPQLLAIILLNIVFIGLFIWFIDARANHTVMVMQQLLDACILKGK